MASIVKTKKCCIKCDGTGNNSGLFTCDGCQNMFCARHVNQHREELNTQFAIVVNEHDLIQQELSQSSTNHIYFKEIDVWEEKSILKIQKVADTARNDLRQLINNFKERSSKICQDIATNLRSAGKTDNFSEIDLEKWKKQLDELKFNIESSISCDLVRDKRSPIYLIKIEERVRSSSVRLKGTSVTDKFGYVCGPVQLDNANMRSKYVGDGWDYGRIRGHQTYSQGRSIIRFKIERSNSPQKLFFGITTSGVDLDQRSWSASYTVGWCGDNNVWRHGDHDELLNQSAFDKFQMGDILQLILDCDQHQIELYNERTGTTNTLRVDITETRFPWQYLVGLRTDDDCVTIL